MSKKRKLLFFVAEDWYFCSHRWPIAMSAIDSGYEVVLVTRVSDRRNMIEDSGVRVIPLKTLNRFSFNPFREFLTIIEIFSIFFREKPDILHLVAMKPVIYGSIVAKFLSLPSRVSALGGLGLVYSSNKIKSRILRPIVSCLFRYILNDKTSRLILQNEDDLSVMSKIGVNRHLIRLIRGAGVDLDEYCKSSLPVGIPVVMLASRLLWDKGVGEFVSAAQILRDRGVQARFVLVGGSDEGSPSAVPIKQLMSWRDRGIVEWWGYRTDMPDVIKSASILCLPSYYGEGVPKVLIEAMAMGRPIVTTDMPGCRDLVRNRKNGLLIKPKDPNGLADAIMLLIENPTLLSEMGAHGRAEVENRFSLKRVTDETLSLYRELLGS